MQADATIIVIDDHDGARQSLCALLEAENFLVRDYPAAEAFLADADAVTCDCLLTDVRMPGMSGFELHEEVKRRGFAMPVIILTGHGDVPLAVSAMRAGAFDFVEKPYDGDALVASVRRATKLGRDAQSGLAEARSAREALSALTERERQVFDHLVNGQSNKLVAHELGISPRTVEIHRARLMDKLKARSLSDLVRASHLAL